MFRKGDIAIYKPTGRPLLVVRDQTSTPYLAIEDRTRNPFRTEKLRVHELELVERDQLSADHQALYAR